MPRPTTETLATLSSCADAGRAEFRDGFLRGFQRGGHIAAGTVNEMSALPSAPTFCTIMSTAMFCAAMLEKMRVADAGSIGNAFERDAGLVLDQRRPADRLASADSRLGDDHRARQSEKLLRTWIGTSNFLANSMER